jgi:hypothetical protein
MTGSPSDIIADIADTKKLCNLTNELDKSSFQNSARSSSDGTNDNQLDVESIVASSPFPIILSSNKETTATCIVGEKKVIVQGQLDELEDLVMTNLAITIKKVLALLSGSPVQELCQAKQIHLNLVENNAQRGWIYENETSQLDMYCQCNEIFDGLIQFFSLISDSANVWTVAAEELSLEESKNGKMLKLARDFLQSAGGKKTSGTAILQSVVWQKGIQIPNKFGRVPDPKRNKIPSSVSGYVTGSDWWNHTINVLPLGEKRQIQVSYDEEEHDDLIEDVRRNRQDIYKIVFFENNVNGVVKSRTFQKIERAIVDIFSDNQLSN